MDYKTAGVDINKVEKALREMDGILKENAGLYGGTFPLKDIMGDFENPVLVSTTDGVGSKLELINEFKRWDIAAQDLVAMNLNDLVCMGAKPLFFLDYYATEALSSADLKDFLFELSRILNSLNCKLIGGETAELRGIFKSNKMDIGGFAVGMVDANKMLSKDKVKKGDLIIGLRSNGIHSNGFTLVRALIKENKLTKNIELVRPTKLYVKQTLAIKDYISAAAHITGGGIIANFKRVIPNGLQAKMDYTLSLQPVFKKILKAQVDIKEAFKVFNMGIGMIYILPKDNEKMVLKELKRFGEDPIRLGKITNLQEGQKVEMTVNIEGETINL